LDAKPDGVVSWPANYRIGHRTGPLGFANSNGFGEPLARVACRDELVAYKAAIAGGLKRAHNAGVMDLLVVVEFASTGIAGRVDVPDQMAMLTDAADQVTVHHLNVIAIEQ